jgi:hypothetical protein
MGEVNACRWLLEHGAAADISKENTIGCTPLFWTCANGHLPVCKWLFEAGAAADVTKANKWGGTPMWIACQQGHLPVCKWLFEVGAAKDISKANKYDSSPMLAACRSGHLPVCKWLYEVGADVTRASNDGFTPMFVACQGGHLSVCQWLFEVGAALDISKANKYGSTPMYKACLMGHLSVCKWLVLVGALNHLPAEGGRGGGGGGGGEGGGALVGHVDTAAAVAATEPFHYDGEDSDDDGAEDSIDGPDYRPALLSWAWETVATHDTFLHVVLRASVLVPASQRQHHFEHFNHRPQGDEQYCGQCCGLPLLPRGVLERVGAFLDVEMGQRLRNVHEFAEALQALPIF